MEPLADGKYVSIYIYKFERRSHEFDEYGIDEEGKKKLRLRGNIIISLRSTPWVCGWHKPCLIWASRAIVMTTCWHAVWAARIDDYVK